MGLSGASGILCRVFLLVTYTYILISVQLHAKTFARIVENESLDLDKWTFPWLESADNDLGIINVAKPPYNADPTGVADSTDGLQLAISSAREQRMTVFVPLGTYRLTDTLNCSEHKRGRYLPTVIVGEVDRVKNPGDRPTFLLHDNTTGFTNISAPKYVVHFWEDDDLLDGHGVGEDYRANANFNQVLQSINIKVGAGNFGAIGVRLRGAQGSNLENVEVDLGDDGFIGFVGASGSGGSHAGLTVIGGKYGLDFRMAQPAPSITGAYLVNQSCSSLIYSGLQTLTAVGIHVESSASRQSSAKSVIGLIASVPPEVLYTSNVPWLPQTGPCALPPLLPNVQPSGPADSGQISLIDSVIVSTDPEDIAITSPRSLYLSNVYVKGPSSTAVFHRQSFTGPESRLPNPCSVDEWLLVEEIAFGITPPIISRNGLHNSTMKLQYTSSVWKNGANTDNNITQIMEQSSPPRSDLTSNHLWNEATFPSFQTLSAVNVKASPYNAVGDGKHDDTQALQMAIDKNEVVLLPKGEYLVSDTLRLQANSKLIGVGRTFSIIRSPSDVRVRGESPKPVLETHPGEGETVLAFFMIVVFQQSVPSYAFLWQTYGPGCYYRQMYSTTASSFPYYNSTGVHIFAFEPKIMQNTTTTLPNSTAPLMVITGGGKFYTLECEDWKNQAPSYRHLLVKDSTAGLDFYQLNTEHGRGDANTEVRNSSNVRVFGLKSEGNYAVLWIHASSHVSLYGYGGNAAAFPLTQQYPAGYIQFPPSLFRISGTCTAVKLINLVDYPRVRGGNQTFYAGQGFDPRTWSIIYDDVNKVHVTPFMERPVLYWISS
eukprot:scpid44997/ scgid1637/ 